jgi:hypothetical protein
VFAASAQSVAAGHDRGAMTPIFTVFVSLGCKLVCSLFCCPHPAMRRVDNHSKQRRIFFMIVCINYKTISIMDNILNLFDVNDLLLYDAIL